MLGWFAHPVFKDGDYPQAMKDAILKKSRQENRTVSRLPEFTEKEMSEIQGLHLFC